MFQELNKKQILTAIIRHKDYSPQLKKIIMQIPETILINCANSPARKINRMVKQVNRDFERAKQFTRTEVVESKSTDSHQKCGFLCNCKITHDYLLGSYVPDHDIRDLILKYFHGRFPGYCIILFNKTKRISEMISPNGKIKVFKKDLSEIHSILKMNNIGRKIDSEKDNLEKNNSERKNLDKSSANKQISRIYNVFYKSQYIQSRDNPKYFKAMIPLSIKKKYGLKIVQKIKNKSLDDFIK